MKNIGIIVNPDKPSVGAVLNRISAAAKRLGVSLRTCDAYATLLPGVECYDTDAFGNQIDALITLGGDGTLLNSVPVLGRKSIPVLGVNLGRLGFLTSVTESEVEKGIEALVAGRYTTSSRVMLDGMIIRRDGSEKKSLLALNDMVIGWGQSTRIVTLDVAMNDEPVASYRCDGIIVSTPTGSTGHSLSAGGPILHPEAAALIMNVVCPHTLSARPLVVPDTVQIRITVRQTGKQLLMSVDGQDGESLDEGDALVIRKSSERFQLVHLPGFQYFSVLRKKLQWSGSNV